MPASILEIKDRLTRVVDENGSVRDMASASEAISILEKMTVTEEELESTRLGLYVNKIRKASKNSPLAKRAKNLILSWKKLINKRTPTPIIQQTRSKTPNSVGSSPSPPEPPDFSIIRNYSSPQLISGTKPRSGTPTSDPGLGKSKKHRTIPDNGIRKKNIPDGLANRKGQSSEVKSGKEALDTGQHTMSVGSNGLKLTFKTRPVVQASTNQKPKLSGGRPSSLQRSQTDSNLQILHNHQKKKKGHKNPNTVSSLALPTAIERITTTQQEDAFNNNNTEHKIKSSKSTPNFTVKKTTLEEVSPRIATPKSYSDLKSSSSENSTLNLKRKREPSMVDATLERSSKRKPQAPKERRLTYDPATGQLKNMPSQEKLDNPISVQPQTSKKKPEKTTTTAKHTSSSFKTVKRSFKNLKTPSGSIARPAKTTAGKEKTLTFGKTAVNLTPHAAKGVTYSKIDSEINGNEISNFRSIEFPERLSPTVNITDTSSVTPKKFCSNNCLSSNLYESRREFRKRKTRRKNTNLLDLKTLFPISSAVETLSSDSDENSSPESTTFCSSINVTESIYNAHPTHSRNCVWPGVTGCRGNNGSWFDWTQTFCIKNHETSEALPGEEEIMPLHLLPYVELD